MGQAIALRSDYTAEQLRRLARWTKDASQARRLLAIAAILDGASRTEAAKALKEKSLPTWSRFGWWIIGWKVWTSVAASPHVQTIGSPIAGLRRCCDPQHKPL